MVCIQAGAGIRPQANRPPGGFRRASPAVGRLRRPGLRPASPAPQIPLISRRTVCSPHPKRAPVLGRGAERAGIRPQANRPSGGFRRASPAVGRLRRPGLRPASPAPQIPLISRRTVCSPHPKRAPVLGRGAERAGIRPQANRPSGGFRRASPAVGRLRRPGLRPASPAPQIPLVSRQTVRPPRIEREKHPPAQILTGPGAYTPRHRRAIARSDS